MNEQYDNNGNEIKKPGNSCLKGCLIGCAVLIGVGILLSAGCFFYMKPFIEVVYNGVALEQYFSDLKTKGWEVDDSLAAKAESGYTQQLEKGLPITWRARENSDSEWIEYSWQIKFGSGTTIPNNLSDFRDVMLVPMTKAALEVHKELKFPLPDGFEVPAETGEVESGEEGLRFRDRMNSDSGSGEGE